MMCDVSLCLTVFSATDNDKYNNINNYRSDTFVAFVIDVIVLYHVLHFVLISPPWTVVSDGLMLMYIMFVIVCLFDFLHQEKGGGLYTHATTVVMPTFN